MSKGGTQTVSNEMPAWIQDYAKQQLGRADDVSAIGYTPWRGPDVAAFQPQQVAAMRNMRQVGRQMGLDVGEGMNIPKARDFGGMSGYSAMPIYRDALSRFREAQPAYDQAIKAQVMNPKTGVLPEWHPESPAKAAAKAAAETATTPVGAGLGSPVRYTENGEPVYWDPSKMQYVTGARGSRGGFY